MEIRKLKAADAEKYWELRLEALKQNPEAFLTSYEEAKQKENPIEQTRERIETTANYTFGAFENGDLFGMVTLVQEQRVKVHHKANIFAMYVSPKVRGRGIGKALIDAAIKKAESIIEIELIQLSVMAENEKAKALYANAGFKVYALEKRAMKDNGIYYDEEHMVLFLE